MRGKPLMWTLGTIVGSFVSFVFYSGYENQKEIDRLCDEIVQDTKNFRRDIEELCEESDKKREETMERIFTRTSEEERRVSIEALLEQIRQESPSHTSCSGVPIGGGYVPYETVALIAAIGAGVWWYMRKD